MGGALVQMTKQCRKCHKVLPVEDFHWNGYRGLLQKHSRRRECRNCESIRYKKSVRGRHRVRPNRFNMARGRLRRAVENGKLKKPILCEECHAQPPRNLLQAHHYKGYEYPLAVQWLCPMCHRNAHRKVIFHPTTWMKEEK